MEHLALGAVLVSILLLPPLFFYLALFADFESTAKIKLSFPEDLIKVAVFALTIHTCVVNLFQLPINYDFLQRAIGEGLNKVTDSEIKHLCTAFVVYNVLVDLALVVLGIVARIFLLATGLHKIPFFNLYDKWWYEFNGIQWQDGSFELKNVFNGTFRKKRDFDYTYVRATVSLQEGTFVYSGILTDWDYLNGELYRITLAQVFQEKIPLSDTQEVELTDVLGESITIPYKNVIWMSLSFEKDPG